MAKEHFVRTKPNCTIGITGPDSQGLTRLTAAITTTLQARGISSVKDLTAVDNMPEEKTRGVTINASHIEFSTVNRFYSVIVNSNAHSFLTNMISGGTQIDGAILYVSAMDGVMPRTQEILRICRLLGVPNIVVFMDKCNIVGDTEILDLVEMEIREIISKYGYDGDNTPIVRGSADKALDGESKWQDKIIDLMDACDAYIPLPTRDVDKPFLMPIEDIFTIAGRGTVATGRIERGTVHVNDTVARMGLGETVNYVVTSVEMFRKLLDDAQAGDSVGLLLRGAEKKDIIRGMVLAAPDSVSVSTEFDAEIYVLSKDEGGRHTPFTNGYRPQFYIRTTDITGTVELLNGVEMVSPGDFASIHVKLIQGVVIEKFLHFAIREGGRTVAAGVVVDKSFDYYKPVQTPKQPQQPPKQPEQPPKQPEQPKPEPESPKQPQPSSTNAYNGLLGNIPTSSPLLLFPVRLETSFCYSGTQKQLRVRIIPDELMMDYKKNAKLTNAEIEDGKYFWIQWYIASGCEKREKEAWDVLCSKYPLYKAAWICDALRPKNFEGIRTGGQYFYRRPYANRNEADTTCSGLENIEKMCDEIYSKLSDLNFNEGKISDSSYEEKFEESVRKKLGEINKFIFDIESQLQSCEYIVDYLYDNVHETFLYLFRHLESLKSIYKKWPSLSQPRSMELWDIDASILNALYEKTKQYLEHLDNRRITLSDMIEKYLERKKEGLEFPDNIATRDAEKPIIAVCRTLPHKFALIAEVANKNKSVISAFSRDVNASGIQMAFSMEPDEADEIDLDSNGELKINQKMRWLTDYDVAEKLGMAITVNIDSNVDEFRYIYVVGVQSKNDPSVLRDLFLGHNYVNSHMRILNAGTPTNIVNQEYVNEDEKLKNARYDLEIGSAYKGIPEKKIKSGATVDGWDYDVQKIAQLFKDDSANQYERNLLGCWAKVIGCDSRQDFYAKKAYSALWDYLESNHYWKNKVGKGIVVSEKRTFMKSFFINHVRARGNFAALRIDDMPYGILPISDFVEMKKSLKKSTNKDDKCLCELLNALIKLAKVWHKVRNDNAVWSEMLVGENVQKKYLEMAGQTPYSVGFTDRLLLNFPGIPSNLKDAKFPKRREKHIDAEHISIFKFIDRSFCKPLPVADMYRDYDESNCMESKVFSNMVNAVKEAIKNESKTSDEIGNDAKLFVMEFLDLLTHRIDAWFLGIIDYWFCKKISDLGSGCIGAFGWVFNLKEDKKKKPVADRESIKSDMKLPDLKESDALYTAPEKAHFIAAPSIQHALTAAVLRSSFINAKKQNQATNSQICVNLSSTRVRQALRLVEGVKSGMSLSIILGMDLERYMHEAYDVWNCEMDQYIYPLRQVFPQVTQIEAEDSKANDYVMQVINGEALLNSFIDQWGWNGSVSGWLKQHQSELSWLPLIEIKNGHKECFFKLIERLMDSYDAMNDLLLSEGVHRLIMGDRAAYRAISKFLAKGECSIPDMQILDIPSEHVVVTHKAGVLLPRVLETSNKVMCDAEPALNAWIEGQFNGMENVLFFVKAEKNGKTEITPCSLAQVGVSGIEYVYLSTYDKTFHAYLEARYRKFKECYTDEITIQDNALDAGYRYSESEICLEDNKLRLAAIRSIISRGRSMNTADWDNSICEDKPESDLIDFNDLQKRYSITVANLENLKIRLGNWLEKTENDGVFEDSLVAEAYDLLCDSFEAGVVNCFTQYEKTAYGHDVAQNVNPIKYDDIYAVQQDLRQDVKVAYGEIDSRVKNVDGMAKSTESADTYVSALQAIILKNFKVFYKFKTDAVMDSFGDQLQQGLEFYTNIHDGFDQWQDEMSEVREGMRFMHQLSMAQMALDHDMEKVAILQAANLEVDGGRKVSTTFNKWMGAEVETESDLCDADSLILYNSPAYKSGDSGSLSGFVFDSWIEYIPYRKHDAGFAFHNDWPDNEAPQTMLVAWHPTLPALNKNKSWDLDSIFKILRTTRFMMMNRTLEPDHIYGDPLLSRLLPLTPKMNDFPAEQKKTTRRERQKKYQSTRKFHVRPKIKGKSYPNRAN